MFKRVLLALDSSPAAWELFNIIPDLRIMGMNELVILHVVNIELLQGRSLERYRENYLKLLQGKLEALEGKGIHVKLVMPFGHPSELVALVADEEDVDLILIGSIGESSLREFLLGSTVADVIRRSNRPVMVEKYISLGEKTQFIPSYTQKWASVLLPTDFTEASERIYKEFLKVAEHLYRIILLHVVDKRFTKKERRDKEDKAYSYLEEWQAKFKEKNANVDFKIVLGAPAKKIAEVADSEGATLIALPAQESGISTPLIGRTADSLLKLSGSPLLLFKGHVGD